MNFLTYSRQVNYDEAKQIKHDYNFEIFLETSAKNGLNVNKLCCQMAKILYENFTITKKRINKVNNIFNLNLYLYI